MLWIVLHNLASISQTDTFIHLDSSYTFYHTGFLTLPLMSLLVVVAPLCFTLTLVSLLILWKLHFLSLRWNIIYTVTSSLTYQHRQVSSYKCSVSLFVVFIKIIMESLIVQLGCYFFRLVSLNRMEYPWIKKQSFLFTTVSPSLAEFPDYWNVQQIFLWWIKENMIK